MVAIVLPALDALTQEVPQPLNARSGEDAHGKLTLYLLCFHAGDKPLLETGGQMGPCSHLPVAW